MPRDLPTSFYEADGDAGFSSTELTRGPWNRDHQHAGPPAALLARAITRATSIGNPQLTRLSFDILRPVEIAPVALATTVLRPGRRVEQIEATLRRADDDEPLMRCTAWVMRTEQLDVGASNDPPPSAPDTGEPGDFGFWTEPVAYHRAFEWRFVAGRFDTPGPATAWTRMTAQLVTGEEPSPLERLLAMADAASGISAALDWGKWLFVNVDLGIHLERQPEGEWMAMEARTRIGPRGAGLCTSVLSDRNGRVGVSTQSLLVAPR